MFWPFPHSQIYSETARLADLGLLTGTQEPGGRRRHVYAITEAGTKALGEWPAQPSHDYPQLRSLGLIQLYFGHFARPEDRLALAKPQLEVAGEMLAGYQQIAQRLTSREDRAWQLRVADMAIAHARTMEAQWLAIAEIAANSAGPEGSAA
jgi:PadR family transcriptional regulator, regulatory protein AphA